MSANPVKMDIANQEARDSLRNHDRSDVAGLKVSDMDEAQDAKASAKRSDEEVECVKREAERLLPKTLDEEACGAKRAAQSLDNESHPAELKVAGSPKDLKDDISLLDDETKAEGFEKKLDLLEAATSRRKLFDSKIPNDDPILNKTKRFARDLETGIPPESSSQPANVATVRNTSAASRVRDAAQGQDAGLGPGAFAATLGTTELQRNDTFHAGMLQEHERMTPQLQIRQSSGAGDPTLGLAVANEVTETSRPDLPQAREQSNQKQPPLQNQRSRGMTMYWLGGIGLLAGIVLLLVFLLAGNRNDSAPTTASISASPSQAPSFESLEDHVLSLLPEETNFAILQDATSPQAFAFEWMMEDPNLDAYQDYRIVQRFAMATVYYATGGTGWSENRLWMSYDYHECQWYSRLEVTRTGGSIDAFWDDWISQTLNYNLSHLEPYLPCEGSTEQVITHLWLYNNMLEGTLPRELYLLTSLKSVQLDKSRLEGSRLSSEIGMLSNLELFTMWRTDLGGTLPSEVGLLTNLLELGLSANNVTGPLPSELGLLSSNLRLLVMDHNELTGTIPTFLGLLSRVEWFILWVNQLTGSLPTELGQLSSVDDIPIEFNQLTGPLPSELGLLSKLTSFWMHGNQFSGKVPSELGQLTLLHMWQVSDNYLSGTIPTELFHPVLRLIYLDGNQLTGEIPTQVGLCDSLLHLELRDNQLRGPIPSEIGLATSLTIAGLSYNQLTGSIPPGLDALALNGNFSGLFLEGNDMSGDISAIMCDLGTHNNDAECPWRPYWWSVAVECGLYFDCSESFNGCGCLDDEASTNNQSTMITVVSPDPIANRSV